MSIANVLSVLDDSGISEACRQTHPLWHQGWDLDGYERRLRESFARMGDQMRYVGLRDAEGTLAASARWLELEVWLRGRPCPTVGIAAVYVREDVRGQGLGRSLIRSILAEAGRTGHELALLYSDIGRRYYERQGFVPAPSQDWTGDVSAIPSANPMDLRLADPPDCDWMLDVFHRRALGCDVCPIRTAAWWGHYRWWRGAARDLVLVESERAVGYATVRTDGDTMRVFEWVAPEVESDRVWASLRREAVRRGCRRLTGWLQPDRREAWMQVVERGEGLPMVALIGGGRLELDSTAVFEELDHF